MADQPTLYGRPSIVLALPPSQETVAHSEKTGRESSTSPNNQSPRPDIPAILHRDQATAKLRGACQEPSGNPWNLYLSSSSWTTLLARTSLSSYPSTRSLTNPQPLGAG